MVDDIPAREPVLENGESKELGTPRVAHPFTESQEALSSSGEWKAVRHGLV